MKKIRVSAVFAGILLGAPLVAGAAYPAYPTYQATGANGQMMYLPSANSRVVSTNGYNGYMPTGYSSVAAAQPSRVTGALPRVGSSQTTAGRQYYQPADYDRLADSGLYVGLSVGYTASLMGSMKADYIGEEKSFAVPGAFVAADFASDSVIPLQISVGAALNNDVRVDFSYLRYSNISYPRTVQTDDGAGDYVEAQVDGGAITANATMLNIYYNIDSFTGYLAGGSLRPYVGAGVGISLNTIADYVVYDNNFYSVNDPQTTPAGIITGISDIYAYHNGGTNEQLAFMLEGGLTTELEGGIKMDFFVRYANLGRVKTSGSIVLSQVEWLSDGSGTPNGEQPAQYDSVLHYTNWYESGRLGMVDLGLRLRLQF